MKLKTKVREWLQGKLCAPAVCVYISQMEADPDERNWNLWGRVGPAVYSTATAVERFFINRATRRCRKLAHVDKKAQLRQEAHQDMMNLMLGNDDSLADKNPTTPGSVTTLAHLAAMYQLQQPKMQQQNMVAMKQQTAYTPTSYAQGVIQGTYSSTVHSNINSPISTMLNRP